LCTISKNNKNLFTQMYSYIFNEVSKKKLILNQNQKQYELYIKKRKYILEKMKHVDELKSKKKGILCGEKRVLSYLEDSEILENDIENGIIICSLCNEIEKEMDQGILCELCGKYYHEKCYYKYKPKRWNLFIKKCKFHSNKKQKLVSDKEKSLELY